MSETKEKTCLILRGLPSSGKTTLAKRIANMVPSFSEDELNYSQYVCSADDFHYDNEGNYNFDPAKMSEAHAYCKALFADKIDKGQELVIVANTNTSWSEFKDYGLYAELNGYLVFHLIVETRHDNKNNHEVPDETVKRMRDRFVVSL